MKSLNEHLNEASKFYPYQVDDKRGMQLYDKFRVAIEDDKWTKKHNSHTRDNYEEHYPLDEFIKKSKMTVKELEELEAGYTDESWGLWIDEDKNELVINHD